MVLPFNNQRWTCVNGRDLRKQNILCFWILCLITWEQRCRTFFNYVPFLNVDSMFKWVLEILRTSEIPYSLGNFHGVIALHLFTKAHSFQTFVTSNIWRNRWLKVLFVFVNWWLIFVNPNWEHVWRPLLITPVNMVIKVLLFGGLGE